MTEEFYLSQVERLRGNFGPKEFSEEKIKVLGKEVAMVSPEHFRHTVDTWIGSRKTSDPPRIAEFRECKAAWDRNNFKRDCRQASYVFNSGKEEALRREFKVDSVKEAFELAKLKLRLRGTDGGST